MSKTNSSQGVDAFEKKIFEIGAEMTEKIEIKLLAPLYTWAVTIQCVPKKFGINENFKPL